MIKENKLLFAENTNHACFADFPSLCLNFYKKNKVMANRMLYMTDFKRHSSQKEHLTVDEITDWTNLCKEHKLFPRYIGSYFIRTGNFVVFLDELDPNTLYAYLAAARYCSDEPYLVRTFLYFVKEHNMDFFLALLSATACNGYGTGHSVLPLSRSSLLSPGSYGRSSFEKVELPINYAASLRKFLYKKPSTRKSIEKIVEEVKLPSFRLHESLGYTYNEGGMKKITGKDTLNPETVKAVYKD
jgi:hypothetical protein